MNITKISPNFSVTGPISGSDVGVAAAQGFKTIICNRPDDEAQGQPAASEIAAAAEALGIEFLDLLVRAGAVTDVDTVRPVHARLCCGHWCRPNPLMWKQFFRQRRALATT